MKLILIAGGTAAGKTEFSNKIKEAMKGYSFTYISFDYYYNPLLELTYEERIKKNFDEPSIFRFDLLKKDLINLKKGKKVHRNVYDYPNYTHFPDKIETFEPNDIVVVEGIFALYNQEINAMADLKFFMATDHDIRLIRRIKRDVIVNKHIDLNWLLDLWQKEIKPMHNLYVNPTRRYADIIIPNNAVNNNAIEVILNQLFAYITGEENGRN